MKLVIVEDEVMVARRLIKFCQAIFNPENSDGPDDKLTSIKHFMTLDDAEEYLDDNIIDVLLLDLNLNGQDGFELLKSTVAAGYQTIVVSANTERAIEAFEYGVLDFVGKPFNQQRLEKAFDRLHNNAQQGGGDNHFLSVKKLGRIERVDLQQIRYIQAASHYSELVLLDGKIELHDKNLERLLQELASKLPGQFERVHKSYIVPINQIKALIKHPGSKYELQLHNDECVPLGRTRYAQIKERLFSAQKVK
ncbi:MAG: two-component system response regulator LytT [Phenylobacterium sp.]|jgi:two-component system response regulator LytT